LADVGGVARRGGDVDSEVGVVAVDQLDAVPCRQQNFTVRGVDDAGVFDVGGDEVDLSASLCGQATGVADVVRAGNVGEVVAPGEEVGVAEIEGGGDHARDVDGGVCAEHDAAGVDEEHATVGLQAAQDVAGVVGDDAVEYGGAGALLGEAGDFVGSDGEALPVDDGVRGVGDGEGVAFGGEAGLTGYNRRADGVGVGGVGSENQQQ
jgi:hypothetical protein